MSSICNSLNSVRDYAFDELPAPERVATERHIASCGECAAELDRLRLTTAALRALADAEVPQRLAFVSDKVFRPSPVRAFFTNIWKPAMISASVMAAALIVHLGQAPATVHVIETRIQPASQSQIEQAVAKAVADVRRHDEQTLKTALDQASAQRDREHKAVMEAINIMQERQNTATLLAAADVSRPGAGQ